MTQMQADRAASDLGPDGYREIPLPVDLAQRVKTGAGRDARALVQAGTAAMNRQRPQMLATIGAGLDTLRGAVTEATRPDILATARELRDLGAPADLPLVSDAARVLVQFLESEAELGPCAEAVTHRFANALERLLSASRSASDDAAVRALLSDLGQVVETRRARR